MQTLRACCSKAEPKIFTPPQTPFPGVQDGQNLISWRWSLPSPTDQVWWKSMHAISSYHGNRHRPPARYTPLHTHRQDWLQYTAPQLASTQCNNCFSFCYQNKNNYVVNDILSIKYYNSSNMNNNHVHTSATPCSHNFSGPINNFSKIDKYLFNFSQSESKRYTQFFL